MFVYNYRTYLKDKIKRYTKDLEGYKNLSKNPNASESVRHRFELKASRMDSYIRIIDLELGRIENKFSWQLIPFVAFDFDEWERVFNIFISTLGGSNEN